MLPYGVLWWCSWGHSRCERRAHHGWVVWSRGAWSCLLGLHFRSVRGPSCKVSPGPRTATVEIPVTCVHARMQHSLCRELHCVVITIVMEVQKLTALTAIRTVCSVFTEVVLIRSIVATGGLFAPILADAVGTATAGIITDAGRDDDRGHGQRSCDERKSRPHTGEQLLFVFPLL